MQGVLGDAEREGARTMSGGGFPAILWAAREGLGVAGSRHSLGPVVRMMGKSDPCPIFLISVTAANHAGDLMPLFGPTYRDANSWKMISSERRAKACRIGER